MPRRLCSAFILQLTENVHGPQAPSRHQPPLGSITITHSSSARKEGENHLFPFSNQKLIIRKVIGFNIKMELFCSRDIITYMLKNTSKIYEKNDKSLSSPPWFFETGLLYSFGGVLKPVL